GDTLVLAAGATFAGPFTLPAKQGGGWITVRSSALDRLPAGRRVTPTDAPAMPALQSATDSVLVPAPGAHHYKLIGLELRPTRGAFLSDVVRFGAERGQTAKNTPSDLIIERCYIHGDPYRGSRRGLALNARNVDVVDSHFSDFKEVGADSQAIAGW